MFCRVITPSAPTQTKPALSLRLMVSLAGHEMSNPYSFRPHTEQQNKGAELAAFHHVTKPLRKRHHLDVDPEVDAREFAFLRPGPDSPSSTPTPQHRSKSLPGFFMAGRRAPTPLARTADTDAYLCLEGDDLAMPRAGTSRPPVEGAPCTPPPRRVDAGPSSNTDNPVARLILCRTTGFSVDLCPFTIRLLLSSPYPLVPITPSNPQDIPERSAQLATPILGEPWKSEAVANPATISQGVALPRTPTYMRDHSRYDWGTPV
ncbi:hypothetical protein JB92DRAFT_2049912 [Gautieria morchelliformis]|nr:hypothetical protein JB92DRAFT_2049912 [Gautieria morchelliformis]